MPLAGTPFGWSAATSGDWSSSASSDAGGLSSAGGASAVVDAGDDPGHSQSLETCGRSASSGVGMTPPSTTTAVPGDRPTIPLHPEIPQLTDRVYPCHEVVHMDYFLPGCPPSNDAVFAILDAVAHGRPIELPTSLTHFD